jgi:hypothetical protein
MMRGLMAPEWPVLSFLYGLHPWDLERLSPIELAEYREQAKKLLGG